MFLIYYQSFGKAAIVIFVGVETDEQPMA